MKQENWNMALKLEEIKTKKTTSAWDLLQNGFEQLELKSFKDVLAHNEVICEAIESRQSLEIKLTPQRILDLKL